jgi:hypothetical protein
MIIGFGLVLGAVQGAEIGCIKQPLQPDYPRLARLAAIQGDIRLHFVINEAGQASDVTAEGNGVLRAEALRSVAGMSFDPSCRGPQELVYKFVLDGPEDDLAHTTVTSQEPNRFVITSNPTGIVCILRTETRRLSWIKRLFAKL